ncbi:MAG: (Glutamate--ammonia-ligase) adenylyltransferase, partial [Xanthomonadaceae bacterium]|nr:(Glutamate--ammonia-ligase) adenylyltransferase [Xanthomonadaceae bacterium]
MDSPGSVETIALRALERLRSRSPSLCELLSDTDVAANVTLLAVASDFAIATLHQQPGLLPSLIRGNAAVAPVLADQDTSQWPVLLRRFRAAESARLVWRDVLGQDDVDATLAGSTQLAECCLQLALDALEREFVQRYGVVRNAAGVAQRLVVFGLGKL